MSNESQGYEDSAVHIWRSVLDRWGGKSKLVRGGGAESEGCREEVRVVDLNINRLRTESAPSRGIFVVISDEFHNMQNPNCDNSQYYRNQEYSRESVKKGTETKY